MTKLRAPIDPTAQPIHCPNCHSGQSFQHNEKKDIHMVDEQGQSRLGWKAFVCGTCPYVTLSMVRTSQNQNLEV